METSEETTGSLELAKAPPPSKLRIAGFILFGVAVFLVFLVLKFPEGRLQNYVIAHARILMQNEGLSFSAEKVQLSFILGPAIKFYNVEIKALDDDSKALKISYLKLRPKISSLLAKNKKVGVSAELLGGELSGTVGGSATSFFINLDLDHLNLGQSTLFRRYTIVELKAELDGTVKMDFDSSNPTQTDGKILLKAKNIHIPDQVAYGFNLPNLKISQCSLDIPIEGGKADFRLVECGKDLKTDDIVGTISGQIAFEKTVDDSKVNLRTVFQLSQNIINAFPLLDALLANAKTSDGKYLYRIGGVIGGLSPIPGG